MTGTRRRRPDPPRATRDHWKGLRAPTAALLVVLLSTVRAAAADPPAAGQGAATVEQLARRMEQLEAQNAALAQQNRTLVEQLQQVQSRYEDLDQRFRAVEAAPSALPTPPTPSPAPVAPPPVVDYWQVDPAATPAPPRFQVGEYDDDRGAFVLVRPTDAQRVPFELRLDLFTQARYFGFTPSAKTWTDSTGAVLPVRGFDSIEVNRNFFQFSGFGIDPKLQYTLILFSSTSINDTVFLGWMNYHFSDALDVRVGNWVLPGTREWYESFRFTMGADRLMATTYFRPNISPGIWAQGEPIENVHYVAMLANSWNRFTHGIERLAAGLSFGGTVWWDVWGDFGVGPSDLEYHERPSARVGTSGGLSHEANQGVSTGGVANPEDTILRLSDGTPLFRPGALGNGSALTSTGVSLWTIDGSFKYRGLGLSGEYFLRWLGDFKTLEAAPGVNSVFDHGGLLQAGYFLVPKRLEGFARTSFVTGPFGTGAEWGGGLNWYVRGTRDWRMTAEVLRIDHSPAQNLLTGYRAGASGTLFQLQWFTDF